MRNPGFPLDEDTIAAVSTPYGVGGIGIVRITGSDAQQVVARLFLPHRERPSLASHRLYYGTIRDPRDGSVIDEVLLTFMRAPHTYTREDMTEIHCHGGPLPVRKILELVLAEGVRLAGPGEFTRRAFVNGRIDLVQAEAVLDTIEAKSETALRFAQRQLEGRLSREMSRMHEGLRSLLAVVEAWLDFPDEDLGELDLARLRADLEAQAHAVASLLATYQEGHLFRDGVTVVIGGRPNVGKSTLLNALTGKARAIVSATAGTTRDFLEESLLIGGIPVCLVDTAGIQEALEDVEAQGVTLARRQLEAADLVLWVVDASRFGDGKELGIALPADRTLLVLNKIDLVAGHPLEDVQSGVEANLSSNHVVSSENTGRWPAATALGDGSQPGSRSPSTGSASHSEPNRLLPAIVPTFVAVSALTGSGMERLRQAMLDRLTSGKMDLDSRAVITNVRHRTALERCLQALERARAHLGASEPAGDLLAQDLRLALRALGDILGETTGEDILGRIFERFCVGK